MNMLRLYPIPQPIEVRAAGKVLIGAEAEAALKRYLRKAEPGLRSWTTTTWTQFAKEITTTEINTIALTGDLPAETAARIEAQYAAYINEKVQPRWKQAMVAGSKLAPANVRELLTADVINEWAERRGETLFKGLIDVQQRAVSALVRAATTTNPLDQKTLASLIAPILGLKQQDVNALLEAQKLLAAKGLNLDTQRHRLGQMANRRQAIRAERIARTELASAFNGGTQVTMERAEASGAFEGKLVRVWRAQRGNTCAICAKLNGKEANMTDPFDGAYRLPPAHPSCRCVVLYEERPRGA
jgi:hypothetical protein